MLLQTQKKTAGTPCKQVDQRGRNREEAEPLVEW